MANVRFNQKLTGTFPSIISGNNTNYSSIQYLILNDNAFEGSISTILPEKEYPFLSVAAFHSNKFEDKNVGPLLRKLFECSPELAVLTLYGNDVSGEFPSFKTPLQLPNLHVLAAHRLDIDGTLPHINIGGKSNWETDISLTLFGNRLSGQIPKHLTTSSSNNTLLILQGNLFQLPTENKQPSWIQNTAFIDVSALYLSAIELYQSWGLLILSMLCLLFAIIKTKYTFPYLRYARIEFLECIRLIDNELSDYKMLALICVLLVIYPLFASYYSEMPILSQFSLYFVVPPTFGWKAVLVLLFVIYNLIVIDITTRICILGHSLNSECDVIRSYSVLPAEPPRCKMEVKIHTVQQLTSEESSLRSVINFIFYGILFTFNMLFLFGYILTQSLPDDNRLGIGSIFREISSHCISLIIAVSSSLVFPKFAHYSLSLFRCPVTKNVNKCILIIRTITTIIIPITLSFLLLDDCGRGWVVLWNRCDDKSAFDISSTVILPHFDEAAFPSVEVSVLQHDDICAPLRLSNIDWNKCTRSFLYQWCNVLMVKMVIMMIMPLLIIIKKTLCHKVRGKEKNIVIDSEYTMLTTKLEIIFVFGIFNPLLYPVSLVSMNSFIFFYVFAAKKLKWNIVFSNFDHGLRSFPFHFLVFGIVCGQMLTVLFIASDDRNDKDGGLNTFLSWGLVCSYLLMDIFAIWRYKKRVRKLSEQQTQAVQ